MIEVKLFVEGGGDSDAQHRLFRENLHELLKKDGLAGRIPRIVACGGREQTYDAFKNYEGGYGVMLVDSEKAVPDFDENNPQTPWQFLAPWQRPAHTSDEQCHLMAQCMEAWLLADWDAVKEYYGKGFNENALPKGGNLPSVSKQALYSALESATAACKKGVYSKGGHGFELAGKVDPARIRASCKWADRFFNELHAIMDRFR